MIHRKLLAGALAAALSLSLGIGAAQAHCIRRSACAHTRGECVRCVDRNRDGLCDVCRVQTWFVDEDGDSLCDRCGSSRRPATSRYTSGGCHGRSRCHR